MAVRCGALPFPPAGRLAVTCFADHPLPKCWPKRCWPKGAAGPSAAGPRSLGMQTVSGLPGGAGAHRKGARARARSLRKPECSPAGALLEPDRCAAASPAVWMSRRPALQAPGCTPGLRAGTLYRRGGEGMIHAAVSPELGRKHLCTRGAQRSVRAWQTRAQSRGPWPVLSRADGVIPLVCAVLIVSRGREG